MDEESRKAWMEFRSVGLLWWINRALHLFGWAIVLNCEVDKDGKVISVVHAYPVRVKWRGFDLVDEADGFRALSAHLAKTDAFEDGQKL